MRRILVIRGGAIGDFIFTLPVFEALKTRDPAAEVDLLGYARIGELAVGRRHAANLRRVDGAEWAALFSPGGRLGEAERRYLSGFDETFCVWPDADGVIGENLLRAGSSQRRLRGPDAGRGQGRPRRGPHRAAVRKGGAARFATASRISIRPSATASGPSATCASPAPATARCSR